MQKKGKQILMMSNLAVHQSYEKMLGMIPRLHQNQSSKFHLKPQTSALILNKQYTNLCSKYILSDCLKLTSTNNAPHLTNNYQS